jgi:hypothetical protein
MTGASFQPQLTPVQVKILRWCKGVGAPVSVGDVPYWVTLSTLRILARRGLLQITVAPSQYGIEAVQEVDRREIASAHHADQRARLGHTEASRAVGMAVEGLG